MIAHSIPTKVEIVALIAFAAFAISAAATESARELLASMNEKGLVTIPSAANLSPKEAVLENGDGISAWSLTEGLHGTDLTTLYATSRAGREPITLRISHLKPGYYRVGVLMVVYVPSGAVGDSRPTQLTARIGDGPEKVLLSSEAKSLGLHHSHAGYDYHLYLAELGEAGLTDQTNITFGGAHEGYLAGVICEPSAPPVVFRSSRTWDGIPERYSEGPFRELYGKGPPGNSANLRLELAASNGLPTHLGWDSEGGNKADLNLLRATAVLTAGGVAVTDPPVIDSSRDGSVTAQFSEVLMTTTHEGGGFSFSFQSKGPELVELRMPFRSALAAVTVIGGEWDSAGRVHPPFLINAPDIGLMKVSASPADAGSATLTGRREKREVDLALVSTLKEGETVRWSFEPVRMDPPSGLKDQALWPAARRGWANLLQVSAAWGDAATPRSAPPGIFANNVISDVVSGLLGYYVDHILLAPNLPGGVRADGVLRRTVDFWIEQRLRPEGSLPNYHAADKMLDANAGLLIGAWGCMKADFDRAWLVSRWEALERCAGFLAARDVDDDGLIESFQSGNAGTFALEFGHADSAYDTINSGWKNAYINILAYRAFRGMAELADLLQEPVRASHYRTLAAKLKRAFHPCFYNPETGWLGWWRSRDGVLHDYASPPLTGWALTHGLLTVEEARPMLAKLWTKLEESGFTRFDLGVPTTLIPYEPADYHFGPGGDRTVAAHPFGHYLNGGCTVSDTVHFLVGSDMAGLREKSDLVLAAMLQRQWNGPFANGGGFQNGVGGGAEFYDWNGAPTGYEGHLAYSWTFLQAIPLRDPSVREKMYGFLY